MFIAQAIAQSTHTIEVRDPEARWNPGLPDQGDPFEVFRGDTVRWEFDAALFQHDLFLKAPGEAPVKLSDRPGCNNGVCPPGAPPIEYLIEEDAPSGTYVYYCTLHGGNAEGTEGMSGRFFLDERDDLPDPDPQLPNPSGSPGPPWELGTEPPRMLGAKAKGIKRGVRLKLRVSHPGKVNVRFRRGGKVVLKRNLKGLRQGANKKRIRNKRLGKGRYKVQLRYRDKWGLPGQPKVVTRKVQVRY